MCRFVTYCQSNDVFRKVRFPTFDFNEHIRRNRMILYIADQQIDTDQCSTDELRRLLDECDSAADFLEDEIRRRER